jgi:hypothetical protein
MAMDNVMHGTTTKSTYQNKTMPINEKGYPITIGNQGIFVILVENFPLHKFGMYSITYCDITRELFTRY